MMTHLEFARDLLLGHGVGVDAHLLEVILAELAEVNLLAVVPQLQLAVSAHLEVVPVVELLALVDNLKVSAKFLL